MAGICSVLECVQNDRDSESESLSNRCGRMMKPLLFSLPLAGQQREHAVS